MTTTVNRPFDVFTDSDGTPLDNGYLYIGTANQNPESNPVAVYWDVALTIPAVNPIRTINGYPSRNGTPGSIHISDTDYSILVKDHNGVLLYSELFATGLSDIESPAGSSIVGFIQAGTGAVATTLQAKARERLTPEDFGAAGDGSTDDTAAFKRLATYINTLTVPTLVSIEKDYIIDFSAFDLISTDNYGLFVPTRGNLTFNGGGRIIAKAGTTLDSGMIGGDFRYYHVIYSFGNSGVCVESLIFDGNDQFSQFPSSAIVANVWMRGVTLNGDSAAKPTGNQIIKCRYLRGGGWSFICRNNKNSIIDGCYSEHSQGSGLDGCENSNLVDNVSVNSHDAHFGLWNSDSCSAAGNVADTSDNGSGIDVSGSSNVTVTGNTFRNCANRGVWILQDPNTGNKPSNVTIVGNTLYNNNTYTGSSERGDILCGAADATTDARVAGTVDCSGLTIVGNTIFSANSANSITLGKYADNILIEGNTFKDAAASAAARPVSIYFATNVTVRNNNNMIRLRKGASGEVKVLGTGPVWFTGVYDSLDSSVATTSMGTSRKSYFKESTRRTNAGKSYQIDERFGYSIFGAEFNSANGSVNICEIGFTGGGFAVADIEVLVTVGGDKGVLRKRVTYQGYSTITPTESVAANDVYSGGTAAPTVTFTAATGKVTVAVGSVAIAGASIKITVSGISAAATNITSLL